MEIENANRRNLQTFKLWPPKTAEVRGGVLSNLQAYGLTAFNW